MEVLYCFGGRAARRVGVQVNSLRMAAPPPKTFPGHKNWKIGGIIKCCKLYISLNKYIVVAVVVVVWGGRRFSSAFRAGAPSPLAYLALARPFFLAPTTSKRLLSRL